MTNRSADGRACEFDALYAEFFGDIWRFVRRRVANTADADDVTAEVFTTAWRRFDDVTTPDERRLWLYGVARNTLRNLHRGERRRTRLAARLFAVEPVVPLHPGPESRIDTAPPLAAALASLSADDRDLLLMRAWDELTVNDIAMLLGVTPNAASRRLVRARARLKEALAAHEVSDDPGGGHEESDPGPANSVRFSQPNERSVQ